MHCCCKVGVGRLKGGEADLLLLVRQVGGEGADQGRAVVLQRGRHEAGAGGLARRRCSRCDGVLLREEDRDVGGDLLGVGELVERGPLDGLGHIEQALGQGSGAADQHIVQEL